MHQTISEQQAVYLSLIQKKKKQIHIGRLALFLLFLASWEISVRTGWLNGFIFSSPSRIFFCFLQMTEDHSIFFHIAMTLGETLISFLLTTLLSIVIAVLLWWFPTVENILDPYLVVLNSLPKSALAPILIVWLGNNVKTIIITAISIAVFGAILNLYQGFGQVDENRLVLIRTLGGTKSDCLFRAVLPSCLPLLISIMKVGIGLSLIGVIIGEFLAAKAGLGYLIIYGSQVFKMDWVMMSIVILCLIAMTLYLIIRKFERKYSY